VEAAQVRHDGSPLAGSQASLIEAVSETSLPTISDGGTIVWRGVGEGSGRGCTVSTWGWVIEYGIVALLFLLCVGVFFALWAKDRWWRWLDHRDAKREARASQPEVKREL
jgi:hypothetical protein